MTPEEYADILFERYTRLCAMDYVAGLDLGKEISGLSSFGADNKEKLAKILSLAFDKNIALRPALLPGAIIMVSESTLYLVLRYIRNDNRVFVVTASGKEEEGNLGSPFRLATKEECRSFIKAVGIPKMEEMGIILLDGGATVEKPKKKPSPKPTLELGPIRRPRQIIG
jgi:hypothetical protein